MCLKPKLNYEELFAEFEESEKRDASGGRSVLIMRKEIKEFIAHMDCNTTLDEIENICQNEEEWNYVLESFKNVEGSDESIVLPLSLRLRAKLAFKNVPAEEITTLLVQKKLNVGYGKAWIIKEWLKRRKAKTL